MHIYISHHARASPFSSLRRSARHNFREKSTCVSQERNTSAFWYARLDSNQRPLESELSGRQAGKPCGVRVWLVLHKFPPLWRKTSEALSGRASEVFHGSSQIVVCALSLRDGSGPRWASCRDHFSVISCCFLYPSPHVHMESKMGFRLLPSSVSEYSTLGGTSA